MFPLEVFPCICVCVRVWVGVCVCIVWYIEWGLKLSNGPAHWGLNTNDIIETGGGNNYSQTY